MPPRQSQIWAVLYPQDSVERFMYSLTATFYGRMCLSGPVHDLNDAQMSIVHRSVALYDKVAPIIKKGKTHYLGEAPQNWRDPKGWSGICRMSRDGAEALVVIHAYEQPETSDLSVELPLEGNWHLEETLEDGSTATPIFEDGTLILPAGKAFRGYCFWLKRS